MTFTLLPNTERSFIKECTIVRGILMALHTGFCIEHCNTRSDSKVMRLVPKTSFILFIHQLKYCHLQSTSLVPAHTFSSVAAIVCSIPGTQLEECRLRPALQTYGCLLLTQNGVFHCQFCFLE